MAGDCWYQFAPFHTQVSPKLPVEPVPPKSMTFPAGSVANTVRRADGLDVGVICVHVHEFGGENDNTQVSLKNVVLLSAIPPNITIVPVFGSYAIPWLSNLRPTSAAPDGDTAGKIWVQVELEPSQTQVSLKSCVERSLPPKST